MCFLLYLQPDSYSTYTKDIQTVFNSFVQVTMSPISFFVSHVFLFLPTNPSLTLLSPPPPPLTAPPSIRINKIVDSHTGLEKLPNDYSSSIADMAVRRVVVVSRPADFDIEQTTFEVNNQRTPNNNESAPTSQSNDEHVLSKKYTLLSFQCQEGTWLELQSRANAEAIITSSLPIFGPKMFQMQYEKALFYPGDSHWKKLRSIVFFSL